MTITYNAVESRYDVVKRHTPSTENTTDLIKNMKMGMLRNEDNTCSHGLPNIDGIRLDLSDTKQSNHVQVKCEPHDNLFLHNQTMSHEATDSNIPQISSSTSAETRVGSSTSPVSPIAIPELFLPKPSIRIIPLPSSEGYKGKHFATVRLFPFNSITSPTDMTVLIGKITTTLCCFNLCYILH